MDGVEVLPEGAAGVTAMLVLVVGFAALALGQSWFWVVFAAGFGGLVPLVATLSKDEPEPEREAPAEGPTPGRSRTNQSRTEALETLRDRYARGELTHEEFERKLEALMETETPESAAKRVERERAREEA
ncbi:hypothetical protein BRC63_03060 [Halobacteriales archaeon QH_10_70_21]|nr:MAG: hypothetical protein BRC63_03060 [Halobacteriales archaeon QH_10_70_21]